MAPLALALLALAAAALEIPIPDGTCSHSTMLQVNGRVSDHGKDDLRGANTRTDAVELCSPSVVQQACSKITGASDQAEVYPEQLADEFGTDALSVEAFFKFLGVDFSTTAGVPCDALCRDVLEAIPEAQRPPSCDLGAHQSDSGLTWDIDLSPEALDLVHIPEQPPDHGTEDLSADNSSASILQDRVSVGTAAKDMPEKFTPERMSVAEMTFELAQMFRMYPAPTPPPAKAANTIISPANVSSANIAAAESCGREAIWDNGVNYSGCQTKARNGKTCVRWTEGPQKLGTYAWRVSSSNFCRNPDGDKTIWCWTGTQSGSEWGWCDPLDSHTKTQSVPPDFAKVANAAGQVAAAFLAKAISSWNAKHLPNGYETWLGPSEADAVYGRTKDGCACKKEWTHEDTGKRITNYCGNPDNDVNGPWCPVQNPSCLSVLLPTKTKDKGCACGTICANPDNDSGGNWCQVEDKTCQGADWGYCEENVVKEKSTTWGYCAMPKTAKGCTCRSTWTYNGETVHGCANPDKDSGGAWCIVQNKDCQGTNWGYCKTPCGDSCKNVRQLLQKTRKTVEKIGFEYDGSSDAFAYVKVSSKAFEDAFQVPSVDGLTQKSIVTKNGEKYAIKSDTIASDYVGERAIMTMCPTWWNLCNGDIAKCKAENPSRYGTFIGTVIHETMHHFPIGADDYLYFRDTIKKWVKANRLNKKAMTLVKDCADCLEYFVEDINGYTDTSR